MRSSYVLSTLLMVCLTNDTATAQYFRGSRGSPVWRFQTFASPKIQMHPGVPLQMHSGSSFQMHGGSPFLMHPGSPVQMYAGTPLQPHPGSALQRPTAAPLQVHAGLPSVQPNKKLFPNVRMETMPSNLSSPGQYYPSNGMNQGLGDSTVNGSGGYAANASNVVYSGGTGIPDGSYATYSGGAGSYPPTGSTGASNGSRGVLGYCSTSKGHCYLTTANYQGRGCFCGDGSSGASYVFANYCSVGSGWCHLTTRQFQGSGCSCGGGKDEGSLATGIAK